MRIVKEWSGGASITQSRYRVVCFDDDDDTSDNISANVNANAGINARYEIQILSGSVFRSLGRLEHLKAQAVAAHFILDDKERIERRVIRDEFMRRLKRA